ncbi:MAG: sulfurtransferase complex subunit TusC [Gammaproteobacteria bacterium]|nr:sulfurtransferase complex subunit TusC [Gammaproteobacteria bacterium]MBT7603931.1 sulfurtransferase complex subunit TusC [Gammaproteobacteria bacterium]
MYVNRKSPYGTIYALESLEVVLITAAFDQDVSLVFTDDGVYQLMKNQNTEGIGMKNFSATYSALGDYEVKKVYIDKESLEERGLSLSDLQELVWEDEDEDYAEKSLINLVSRSELSEIMNNQDVVLSF